jgi:glyoxalase family protein
MSFFITEGLGGALLHSEGKHHQFQIGDEQGHGRMLELVEEPDLAQGSWNFGEGTIHHHALDAVTAENQATVKDWLVGLGFTDVSDVKDRGYFYSVYCRSPGGTLIELAYSTPEGFLIDEDEDELGTHMCIPPHWEDRRAEIAQLEPIETLETVVS